MVVNLLDARIRHAVTACSGERVRTCLLTVRFSVEGPRDGSVGRARRYREGTVPDNFRDRQSPAVATRRSTVRHILADRRGVFTVVQNLRHRTGAFTAVPIWNHRRAHADARRWGKIFPHRQFPAILPSEADGGAKFAPPWRPAATACRCRRIGGTVCWGRGLTVVQNLNHRRFRHDFRLCGLTGVPIWHPRSRLPEHPIGSVGRPGFLSVMVSR